MIIPVFAAYTFLICLTSQFQMTFCDWLNFHLPRCWSCAKGGYSCCAARQREATSAKWFLSEEVVSRRPLRTSAVSIFRNHSREESKAGRTMY